MVDYSKKTVAELTEILKSRSLSHTGKKADLVTRLSEADKVAEDNEAEKAPPAPSTSAPPTQEPEPASVPAAKPAPENTAPTEATSAAVTAEEATDSPANTDTALANSASYALNLPGSEVDSELAKRKARAERFGTGAPPANGETEESKPDDDADKALERAKRFGTGQTTVGKLDEALPAERERGSRKRGRTDETSALDDPALRRGFGGRGGARGRGGGRFRGRGGRDNSQRRTGEKPTGVSKAAFSSDADRAAAEARKKKFASTS